MNATVSLTKRSLKIFYRDKTTVFFSMLSSLIMIALYFLFIAKIHINGIDNPENGGISMALAQNAKYFVVYLQMMAGVLVLNCVSLSTGVFSTIARDFETRRTDSFLLAPIKPAAVIISYFAAGFFASFSVNAATWIISYVIIGAATGFWVSAGTFFMVFLVLIAATFVACSIMLLVTALVKSSSAVGVITGILGTFLGFLCGIYMPYSTLGEGAKAVGSTLPFSHLTIWLKQIMLDNAFKQIGVPTELKTVLFENYFSATSIGFLTLDAPLWAMLIFSAAIAAACLVLSYFVLNKRIAQK